MTKHLRFLMLALLTLVCMGGYSQTKSVVCTLDKEVAKCTTDNPDFKVSWVYSPDAYANVTNGVQFLAKKGQKSFTLTATMPFSVKVSSVTVNATRSSVKKGTKTLEVLIANSSIGTQTITKNALQDFSFVPITPILSNSLVLQLESSVTEASHFIKTVTIEYEEVNSGLTATTTSFGSDYDNKNFNFVDGVLAGFTPPVATCKTEGVAGTIAYSSSDNDIVTVDNGGKLKFTNTKFGTATITATFTPKETTKYKVSSASYTVENKEGERIATTIAFDEGIENATVTVKDGETFEGYKATCTTEGAKGAIQYSSSNTDVATVDESAGAVTMGSKYGKTVITAQFIGTDGYANSDKISYTIEYKGDYAFYESFDKCDSQGGNDGSFDKAATTLIKNDKYSDVAGWTGDMYEAKQCVKLGGKKSKGKIMSPVINVNGNNLLTFKAAAWKGDSKNIIVSVNEGVLTYNNTSAQQVEISLDDTKWTDYEMMVSGTTSFRVTFAAATDKSNRFFLDEVMVKEIAAADVTLDEDKDNVVEAAENANVTLKRTLYADGGWNTLCLPFSLTDAQAKAAFGDDVELRTLASFDGKTLTFAKATGITAGVPCLIKVSKVAENNTYTFTGVSVKAIKADADKYDMDESLTFVGIYAPMDVATEFEKDGNALFLGAANKFYKAKAGTTMKAFRAFFLVPASTDTQALRAVIDGTTTGIDDLNIDTVKADGRVYNLNGQCVGYSLEGLKAGIYIQNGKKVIKK